MIVKRIDVGKLQILPYRREDEEFTSTIYFSDSVMGDLLEGAYPVRETFVCQIKAVLELSNA